MKVLNTDPMHPDEVVEDKANNALPNMTNSAQRIRAERISDTPVVHRELEKQIEEESRSPWALDQLEILN